jgi:hypothetical protein
LVKMRSIKPRELAVLRSDDFFRGCPELAFREIVLAMYRYYTLFIKNVKRGEMGGERVL